MIDRLQLYIFFTVTAVGTLKILFSAPGILKAVDQYDLLRKWEPLFGTTS